MLRWRYQHCSNQHNQRRLHRDHPRTHPRLGRAERTMRALLERLPDQAGISYSEWTVLAFLDGAAPLARSELVRRQATAAWRPASRPGLRSTGSCPGACSPQLTAPRAGSARTRRARRSSSRPHGGRGGRLRARPPDRDRHHRRALLRSAPGRPRKGPPHAGGSHPPGERPDDLRRLSGPGCWVDVRRGWRRLVLRATRYGVGLFPIACMISRP